MKAGNIGTKLQESEEDFMKKSYKKILLAVMVIVLTFGMTACGNGGSAADAMHFAEELTGKYKAVRRPLRGVCLNSDAAALTCIANDFGYESVFSRQLEALGRKSDAVLIFTTSGNSANQIAAVKKARELGITSVVLSGRGGGECSKISDLCLVVPSDDGARIQEIHGVILHTIIDAIEEIV